jgi:hypothetical protein
VTPELESIVDAWRSSGTGSSLFLPTYLPFDAAGAEADPFGTGRQEYYVKAFQASQSPRGAVGRGAAVLDGLQ